MPNTHNRHSRRTQSQIKDGMSTVRDGVQQMGEAVGQYASESVNAVRDTAVDYVDQGRERIRGFSENVESQVRDQPLKAILISAAAGFFLGLFMRR